MPSFKLLYEQDGRELVFTNASVTIGREAACDLQLDHPTISRQHALIVENPTGFDLVVLSASGMTAVNGNQVTGSVPLSDGCRLHFGQMAFLFRSDHAMGRTAALPPIAGPPIEGSTEPRYNLGPAQPGQGMQAQGMQGQGPAQGLQGHGMPGQQPQGMPGQQMPQGMPGQQMPQGMPGQGMPNQTGGLAIGQAGNAHTAANPAVGSAPSPPSHGIVTWDEIASSPEAMDQSELEQRATNFERLAAAQKKASAQSGQNPLMIVGLVGIAALMGFILFYEDEPESVGSGPENNIEEVGFVTILDDDIKCVAESECMKTAERKYAVAMETYSKQDADIPNLFNSYLNLKLTRRNAMKAHELSGAKDEFKVPPAFAELEATEVKAEEELKKRFQDFQVRFHQAKQRREFRKMEQVIAEMRRNFPDTRAVPRRWADDKEIYMKENSMIKRK